MNAGRVVVVEFEHEALAEDAFGQAGHADPEPRDRLVRIVGRQAGRGGRHAGRDQGKRRAQRCRRVPIAATPARGRPISPRFLTAIRAARGTAGRVPRRFPARAEI
ncbi:hypothetical protein [Burkholderia perseverans]|uniref:hypothetical protein n=1 Tax=Burkholderia perseverans TaxID=2615214 RepID=UPI001FEED7CA|nr:hypothetical protein [Burkholderia perseverans]